MEKSSAVEVLLVVAIVGTVGYGTVAIGQMGSPIDTNRMGEDNQDRGSGFSWPTFGGIWGGGGDPQVGGEQYQGASFNLDSPEGHRDPEEQPSADQRGPAGGAPSVSGGGEPPAGSPPFGKGFDGQNGVPSGEWSAWQGGQWEATGKQSGPWGLKGQGAFPIFDRGIPAEDAGDADVHGLGERNAAGEQWGVADDMDQADEDSARDEWLQEWNKQHPAEGEVDSDTNSETNAPDGMGSSDGDDTPVDSDGSPESDRDEEWDSANKEDRANEEGSEAEYGPPNDESSTNKGGGRFLDRFRYILSKLNMGGSDDTGSQADQEDQKGIVGTFTDFFGNLGNWFRF